MSKAAAVREPFIRITKRDKMPVWKKIAIYVVAIILALAVSALFIFFVTKLNPIDVYKEASPQRNNQGYMYITSSWSCACTGI